MAVSHAFLHRLITATTDWYLPNFREVYSLTHWETERADDDLSAYGFTNVGGIS